MNSSQRQGSPQPRMPVEMGGRFDVNLSSESTVTSLGGRDSRMDRLGIGAAEAYAKLFKPRMFCEVMVDEHAVAPLWKGGEPGQEVESSRACLHCEIAREK